MTSKAIRDLFKPGRIVTVTNHYITREDHPCFGTHQRTVDRVSGSHLYFTNSPYGVPWPKASELVWEPDGTILFYGGGAGQTPQDRFLTISFVREEAIAQPEATPTAAWTVQPEGRTFGDRPNGHFRVKGPDGVEVLVSAFQVLATSRENAKAAKDTAEKIAALLNHEARS